MTGRAKEFWNNFIVVLVFVLIVAVPSGCLYIIGEHDAKERRKHLQEQREQCTSQRGSVQVDKDGRYTGCIFPPGGG